MNQEFFTVLQPFEFAFHSLERNMIDSCGCGNDTSQPYIPFDSSLFGSIITPHCVVVTFPLAMSIPSTISGRVQIAFRSTITKMIVLIKS